MGKALVRSKKLLALALSAHTEILNAARAQFFSSFSLALALSNKRAPLNFALIFKRFLEVFLLSVGHFKNLHSGQKKFEFDFLNKSQKVKKT